MIYTRLQYHQLSQTQHIIHWLISIGLDESDVDDVVAFGVDLRTSQAIVGLEDSNNTIRRIVLTF